MSKAIALSDLERVARELPPGQEIFSGPNYQTQAELHRMIRRREVTRVSPIYMDMARPGFVYTIVERHKAPRPAWVRPSVIAAAVLAPVVGLGYAVMRIVDAVAGAVTQAGPILGALAICAAILFGAAYAVRSGSGTYVEGAFRGRITRR